MARSSFRVQSSRFLKRLAIWLMHTAGLVLWFAGFSLIAGGAQAQDLKLAAEAEGKVVFYASFNANDSKTLIDGFQKLYPKIEGSFYRATDAQMMERILTESRAGKPLWDVVMTTTFYGYNMKKRGLFAVYDSPERKFFRDGYKDPQANWTSLYTNYAAFGYNTRMVAKTSVPKSLVDLLRPEWKGNVGLDSRPYEWFGTTVKAMGEEKGLAFMRELAKQATLRQAFLE
jgi:iron(III) transport system substrate-binding protein